MSVAFLYKNHMIIFYKKQGVPGPFLLAGKTRKVNKLPPQIMGKGKNTAKKNQQY